MRLKLLVDNKIMMVEAKNIVVGRGEDCEVIVADKSCSRHHASFYDENGTLKVQDLQSSNGTFLRGKKVGIVNVSVGSRIQLGNVLVVVLEFVSANAAQSDIVIKQWPEAVFALPRSEQEKHRFLVG